MTVYARAMSDRGGSGVVADKFYSGKVDLEVAVELELVLEGKNYKTGKATGKGKGSRSVEVDGKMMGINSFDKRIDAYVALCGVYGLDVDYGALSDSVLGSKYLSRNGERQEKIFGRVCDYVVEDAAAKDDVLERIVGSADEKKGISENVRRKGGLIDSIVAKGRFNASRRKEKGDILGNDAFDVYGIDVKDDSYLSDLEVYGATRDDIEDAIIDLVDVDEDDDLDILVGMDYSDAGVGRKHRAEIDDGHEKVEENRISNLKYHVDSWWGRGCVGWDEDFHGMGFRGAVQEVELSGKVCEKYRNILIDGKDGDFVTLNGNKVMIDEAYLAGLEKRNRDARFSGSGSLWDKESYVKVRADVNKVAPIGIEELRKNAERVDFARQSTAFAVDNMRDRESLLKIATRKIWNLFMNL